MAGVVHRAVANKNLASIEQIIVLIEIEHLASDDASSVAQRDRCCAFGVASRPRRLALRRGCVVTAARNTDKCRNEAPPAATNFEDG